MTMEDQVEAVSGEAGQFPIGLRVLVVDDDRCCLKFVETILRKCQFNVTATSQPMEALEMLREDKNRFEIVITDVNMPGMDGFKLLELIGLEIDVPVILLSAHGDTKFVMKGVLHGACDYLLKPCRMLELQNIWRHVVKKKKHMSEKDKNKNNQNDEQGLAQPENPENSDNLKASQKRKDRNEGEEDENGEIETEDPGTTRKKPRVVWSYELHQKFVAAVTHFTIEKAFPKKILDWMNIEGLTRENVASHLQKYRMYLRKKEAMENKQENQTHIRSIEGLPGSQRFFTKPLSSNRPSGVLSTFNSPSRLTMNGIVSAGLIQQDASQNMNNAFGLLRKFRPGQPPVLLNGNPTSLEVNPINNLSGFAYPSSFPNGGVALASSMNSGPRLPANQLLLQGNQHVLGVASLRPESFDVGTNISSNLLGHEQSKRDWQQGVHLSKFPSTVFGPFETYYHHEMPSNNSGISYAHSPIGLPSMNAVQNPQPNFRVDVPCQEDLIGSVIQTMNCTQKPEGEERKQVFEHNPNHSAMNSLGLADEIMGQNNMASVKNSDISQMIGQSNDNMVSFGQHNTVDKPLAEPSMNFDANNFLNSEQDGFLQSDFDSLDDMVNRVDKQDQNDRTILMDGVFWP